MPRYYFIPQWDSRTDDDRIGTLLANDDAARDYAERIIGELKEAGGYDDSGPGHGGENAARRSIFSLPFSARHSPVTRH